MSSVNKVIVTRPRRQRKRSAALRAATWDALALKARMLKKKSLQELLRTRSSPAAMDKWLLQAGDCCCDATRSYLDAEALRLLQRALVEADVAGRRDAMFRGELINVTEKRAVLHTLLREPAGVALNDVVHPQKRDVLRVQKAFLSFAEAVRTGKVRGITGKSFRWVVCIGIGGSHLCVEMAAAALAFEHTGPQLRFVANVDSAALYTVMREVVVDETLFLVASKTFTTEETMSNAQKAKLWLSAQLGAAAVAQHFACMSANKAAARVFGILAERCFEFWDFVGGRYSVWSAIGLPLAIVIGAKAFKQFLLGGHAMDRHFKEAPLMLNLPMRLAMLHFFYRTFMGYTSRVVLPYSERLSKLVLHLQQLELESNGKSVDLDGNAIAYPTAPVIWGQSGTNGQHSFYQFLHQGSDIVPVDLIAFQRAGTPFVPGSGTWKQHDMKLQAHCVAQSEAFAFGCTSAQLERLQQTQAADQSAAERRRLNANRSFAGGRPSTFLVFPELNPYTLGQLLALYEHKVFVEGILWHINSFDQWGVELGKGIAAQTEAHLRAQAGTSEPGQRVNSAFPLSTFALAALRRLQAMSKR